MLFTTTDAFRDFASLGQTLDYDVVRSDEGVVLSIDIPGIDPATVELTVEGRSLTLSATRASSIPEDATVISRPRRNGSVKQNFQLSERFGDSRGLLTSAAAEGYRTLVEAFEESKAIPDPVDRLNAMGKQYVRTALSKPGHFGCMCSTELLNENDPDFVSLSVRAFELLFEVVTAVAEEHNPKLNLS